MLKTVLILICIWLSILLALTLLTYSFFWYETANSQHLDHLKQLSKGRPKRMVLKGIISSLGSMILVTLFFPFGFWRRIWEPEPDYSSPLPPVILIHGLYHNPSAWALLRWRLKRSGFKDIYALRYNSWRYSFDELLEKLDQGITAVADLFPGKPLILIGHSLGGLLSRTYVEYCDKARDVTAVITLGTPHQGSKLAVLGLGKLAQSLKFNDSLILRLNSQPKTLQIPCIAVHSPVDNLVFPAEALKVPHTGWSHYESSPMSHVGMLFSRRLSRWLVTYLLDLCESNSRGKESDEYL